MKSNGMWLLFCHTFTTNSLSCVIQYIILCCFFFKSLNNSQWKKTQNKNKRDLDSTASIFYHTPIFLWHGEMTTANNTTRNRWQLNHYYELCLLRPHSTKCKLTPSALISCYNDTFQVIPIPPIPSYSLCKIIISIKDRLQPRKKNHHINILIPSLTVWLTAVLWHCPKWNLIVYKPFFNVTS